MKNLLDLFSVTFVVWVLVISTLTGLVVDSFTSAVALVMDLRLRLDVRLKAAMIFFIVPCSDIIEGCGDEDGRRSIIEIDELGTCAEHVLGPVGPSTWSILFRLPIFPLSLSEHIRYLAGNGGE